MDILISHLALGWEQDTASRQTKTIGLDAARANAGIGQTVCGSDEYWLLEESVGRRFQKFGASIMGIILALMATALSAQEYANWSQNGAGVVGSGGGTFTAAASMPDFTWTSVATLAGGGLVETSATFSGTVGIETVYGEADSEDNLRIGAADNTVADGEDINSQNVVTITFASATPASGWAFALLDFDDDQVLVSATDSSDNPVSTAVINSWFEGLFDPDPFDSGTDTAFWDVTDVPANTGVLVGNLYPPMQWTGLAGIDPGDNEAAAAWFSPNISLNSLILNFQPIDNEPGNGSTMHVYIASAHGVVADYGDAPQSYDGNANAAARHTPSSDLYLGDVQADSEVAPPPWAMALGLPANGDDAAGDDEDGVVIGSLVANTFGNNKALMDVTVVNDGSSDAQLVCWIDWSEADGFSDTSGNGGAGPDNERSHPELAAHTLTGAGSGSVVASENFESGLGGWTTSGGCSSGTFVAVDPVATNWQVGDDHTAAGTDALVTGQNAGGSDGSIDVDGGTCTATSPSYAVASAADLSVWYFFGQRDNGDDGSDGFQLELSLNGGGSWSDMVSIGDVTTNSVWTEATAAIPAGSTVKVRISATDGGGPGDIIEAGLDDLVITTTGGGAACTNIGITDDTYTTGNIPAGCSGTATVLWSNIPTFPAEGELIYSRCRITTDGSADNTFFFSDSSPTATGAAADGEVEDDQLPMPGPTAVTIGRIDLLATAVADLLVELGVEQMSQAELYELLTTWDTAAAVALANANRDAIITALADYLDPDGDGQVALLRWDTLEERGTIGFYVERRSNQGAWTRINNNLLPGLITAPMGAEYLLADPNAQSGQAYEYRLIELEATGNTREYGPFSLDIQ